MAEIRRRIRLTDDPLPEAEPAPVVPAPAQPASPRQTRSPEEVEVMRGLWESDELTNQQISERLGCSESLIRYYARQRGWTKHYDVPPPSPDERDPLDPLNFRRAHPDEWGHCRTPNARSMIIRAISSGLTLAAAAALVGVHRNAVYEFEQADPDFAADVASAKARWTLAQNEQAARGRPADARKLLESHPHSRDEHRPPQKDAPAIQIFGLFDRRAPRQVQQQEAPAIEGQFTRLPPDGERAEPVPAPRSPESQE